MDFVVGEKMLDDVRKRAQEGDAEAQINLADAYYDGKGTAHDFEQAAAWYLKAAEQGHASAQYALGLCYKNGQGVPQDYGQAVEWFRKSAEQGNSLAQYNLGSCYMNGQGVPQDYGQAVEWFRKSAEQGHADAQNEIGVSYCFGQGVPQDYAQAKEWFRKSAEQENSWAQYNLGLCYKNGQGVPQDYGQAVEWFRKSAEQGHADAQNEIGLSYYCGQGVPQDYAQAKEWFRKSAEQENSWAQYNLGMCYMNGQGVPQDYGQAVEWYRKAANQGHTDAQTNLGFCYEAGQGVIQNYSQAVAWYQKAAAQGNAVAQSKLGICYEKGLGVPQDYLQAMTWYQQSAEQGNAEAQCNLGKLYSHGHGVPQDFEKASMLYMKAANQGNIRAQFNLGNCYYLGKGVPQDYALAAIWYRNAAKQGNSIAQFNIGYCYEIGRGVAQNFGQAVEWYKKAAEQGEANAKTRLDKLSHQKATANEGSNTQKKTTGSNAQNKASSILKTKYAQGFKYFTNAEKALGDNRAEDALANIRRCLEYYIKILCKQVQLLGNPKANTLEGMINLLGDSGFLSQSELSILHKTRKLSNKGAHVTIDEALPSIDDAKYSLSLLQEAMDIIGEKILGNKSSGSNNPMEFPDIYDPNRRYYRQWDTCYSRGKLLENREYVLLENKARKGDIQAMLDIASGFLGKWSTWNSNGLINVPTLKKDPAEFNKDHCYDSRYYYWNMLAAKTAREYYDNNQIDRIPMKYIANALLESMKYSFFKWNGETLNNIVINARYRYVEGKGKVPDPEIVSHDDLIRNMFEAQEIVVSNIYQTGDLLIKIMNQYPGKHLFAAVHKENTTKHVKYILYCQSYSQRWKAKDTNSATVRGYFAIRQDDIGKLVDDEMLSREFNDPVCAIYGRSVIAACRGGVQQEAWGDVSPSIGDLFKSFFGMKD